MSKSIEIPSNCARYVVGAELLRGIVTVTITIMNSYALLDYLIQLPGQPDRVGTVIIPILQMNTLRLGVVEASC